MTHPEELLAGYVDGTSPAGERAVVDAHLAECLRCRREVTLAGGARSALGSLAAVPAPSGVAARALAGAEGAQPHRQAGITPRSYRVAGIAAAAAAALLVVTLTLPHIGKSTTSIADAARTNEKAGGATVPTTAQAPGAIEIQQVDYDNASLSALS
ncbi:MAG: zf-HC2 domain-containing protein, partial [Actinomycetota bacterium]